MTDTDYRDRDDVSPDEITAAQTPAGAWARATLAAWGVPWPPPSGWRSRLAANYRRAQLAPDSDYRDRDGVSPEEITAAQTPAGAWTRATLAAWGVPWPPPTGWKATLVGNWERAAPS